MWPSSPCSDHALVHHVRSVCNGVIFVVPLHALEALGGKGDKLDGGEWSGTSPGRTLPPGKGPPVPIGQEAGWGPETVWTQEAREKVLLPRIEPQSLCRPVLSQALY
jgi:hypothetical protein